MRVGIACSNKTPSILITTADARNFGGLLHSPIYRVHFGRKSVSPQAHKGEAMTYSPVPEPYRYRVLLVDDESGILDALYTLLESAGYEVLAASNGPDALTIFQQSIRPIELLVTDYDMPGMSGLELACECSRIGRELCVLYVSGAHPNEQLRADLQERKRGFLAKPFRTDDLLRKARELLVESPRQLSLLEGAIGNPGDSINVSE